jgi:protein-disulfide isomerase
MPVARKKKIFTLGDLLKLISGIKITQVVYILLLVAAFLIGYLLARVQILEKGTGGAAIAPTAGAPTQPEAPNPEDVKKKLTVGHLPAKGNPNAKVTIVEFSDFECPFCANFHKDAWPQIVKEYIDTGKVKFYYRHFPLQFHPKAVPLAQVTECANDQGKFWEMHEKIFTENTAGTLATATDDTYKGWAGELGLDTNKFNSCYDSKAHQKEIDEDTAAGSEVGVSGTPTFYINGVQLVGAQPFAAFKAAIDAELAK